MLKRVGINRSFSLIDLGLMMCKKLFKETAAFKAMNARFIPRKPVNCEQFGYETREILECYARHYTATLYHPAGTVKIKLISKNESIVATDISCL